LHRRIWQVYLSRHEAAPLLFLLVLLTLFSGCGTSQGAAPTRSAATLAPSLTTTPLVVTRQVSFVTSDGLTLSGTLYGQGTRAIILSNEGDNDAFAWVPMAQQLATLGYLVLGYAYRPQVATASGLPSQALRDLRAAISFMHTLHTSGITLMGSSLGGLISLKEATTGHFDALVPISAPVAFEGVQLSDTELRSISTSKLFVTSDLNDPYTSDTCHMFAVTPQPKVERIYPRRRHGPALFQGTSGPDLLFTLRQFLQRYAPVN
jgi:pimeloyl-ACP methyl ester carboxylesterase